MAYDPKNPGAIQPGERRNPSGLTKADAVARRSLALAIRERLPPERILAYFGAIADGLEPPPLLGPDPVEAPAKGKLIKPQGPRRVREFSSEQAFAAAKLLLEYSRGKAPDHVVLEAHVEATVRPAGASSIDLSRLTPEQKLAWARAARAAMLPREPSALPEGVSVVEGSATET